MKTTKKYVEFDVSGLPIGYITKSIINAYGFDDKTLEPGEIKPLSFKGVVAENVGEGERYGNLFKEGSLTLGEEIALFNIYLLAKREAIELTEKEHEYLDHKFDRIQYGNILETVVDFDNGDKSMKKRHESDRRVMLISKPDELVIKGGIIEEVKGGERMPKLWPGNGYVGRTDNGPYDADGVPLKTWDTREEAEQTWLDIGANRDFAKDAVSYAWSREEGQGKAIVSRRFFSHDGGRFDLDADRDPEGRNVGIGRSPVSR